MNSSIFSSALGLFSYDEATKKFKNCEGNIFWSLNSNNTIDARKLLIIAESLFSSIDIFQKQVGTSVAAYLLDYKNDFWPEYDENDPTLSWEAVDAGEYNITHEKFVTSITLCDVIISKEVINCEFHDGDLFGGHRIHATFSHDLKILEASI